MTAFSVVAKISIHAPLAGCDPMPRAAVLLLPHFNPRTPCGVRLRDVVHNAAVRAISIHAPLAGCDDYDAVWFEGDATFQSTHPLRGATLMVFALKRRVTFQSTHPLRGATVAVSQAQFNELISIHAPLAGCDIRRPCGARRKRISIHAPLAGCDAYPLGAKVSHNGISIHAPLAGCDVTTSLAYTVPS